MGKHTRFFGRKHEMSVLVELTRGVKMEIIRGFFR